MTSWNQFDSSCQDNNVGIFLDRLILPGEAGWNIRAQRPGHRGPADRDVGRGVQGQARSGREVDMATIIGGIATTHVPAIGNAIAKGLQLEPYWRPFFDGFDAAHEWLAQARPDVAV